MVFPVVMYGCESWTMKKVECQKTDAFELWCWRRLLRIPWTARRSNQSILKEISPKYSLEGLMLKLKLQYFGHLMQRVDSLEKTLILGGSGGRRRRRWQRMRWLNGITDSMGMSSSKLRELVMDREAQRAVIHGVPKSRTQLSDWTELNSSCWWRLISSVFLTRTSCPKTTHANVYYGAWSGWEVSISVLPLTTSLWETSYSRSFFCNFFLLCLGVGLPSRAEVSLYLILVKVFFPETSIYPCNNSWLLSEMK